jgi:hypothetical protein
MHVPPSLELHESSATHLEHCHTRNHFHQRLVHNFSILFHFFLEISKRQCSVRMFLLLLSSDIAQPWCRPYCYSLSGGFLKTYSSELGMRFSFLNRRRWAVISPPSTSSVTTFKKKIIYFVFNYLQMIIMLCSIGGNSSPSDEILSFFQVKQNKTSFKSQLILRLEYT